MTLNWDGYSRDVERFFALADELTRSEARAEYERVMQSKQHRIDLLRQLLLANGCNLGGDDSDVQALNDWFAANLEPDPNSPGMMTPNWASVTYDIALFIGDLMISRHPTLHWELFVWGKRSVAYHKPVIMGMSTENPRMRTNIDITRLVFAYARRIVRARGSRAKLGVIEVHGASLDLDEISGDDAVEVESDKFVQWLQMAARRA